MKAKTRDGAEIFYEIYDFTDPWKAAEGILLHHGLRGNHRLWYNLVPMLAREYRVIAVDARGRGQSTVPQAGFPWSMEQFATDDLAVLDDIGLGQVHYVGTSFGSVIGEYLGATYPERLQTLTLMSAPYRFTNVRGLMDRWLEDMDRLGAREFLRRDVRNMLPPDIDPAVADWQAEQMALVPEHVARDLIRFSASVDLGELLPSIAVPTLLLAASKSDRAPTEETAFMQRQIPNLRSVMLDTHHDIEVTMPDRCAEVILEFLRQHRAG